MPTGIYDRSKAKARKVAGAKHARPTRADHYRFCCEEAVKQNEVPELLRILREIVTAHLGALNDAMRHLDGKGK